MREEGVWERGREKRGSVFKHTLHAAERVGRGDMGYGGYFVTMLVALVGHVYGSGMGLRIQGLGKCWVR